MKTIGLVLILVFLFVVLVFCGILFAAVFKDEIGEFKDLWDNDEWREHNINDRWYDGF